MTASDGLERFVAAQDAGGTYQGAVAELRRGRKTGHWMWFVFPQIDGLGRSEMSRRYAIASLDEARAYLRHPVLGPRLTECASIVAGLRSGSAEDIFGAVDAQKLRSSMTLFRLARGGGAAGAGGADTSGGPFAEVLGSYFGGADDPATVALI